MENFQRRAARNPDHHHNASSTLLFIYKALNFLYSKLFRFTPFLPTSQHQPLLPLQDPPPVTTTSAAAGTNNYANNVPLDHHPDIGPAEKEVVVVVKKAVVVVDDSRWIKHYSSRHRILVVGDGDFSFSACLATAFGCASNMIATSLDSKEFLKKNYGKAMSNIQKLKARKCKVLHGIDATKMAQYEMLECIAFDRIIFNFPFAGFFKDLSRDTQLRRHRRLVSLFLKNAKGMISEQGEIHISHKTNEFHKDWKVEGMASSHGLRLIEAVEFELSDYPGYHTKRGFGGDDDFDCNPSKTYKFGLRKVRC